MRNIFFFLCAFVSSCLISNTLHGQSCAPNAITGEELTNIDDNVPTYTYSAKEYYNLADVVISKSAGTEPDLASYENKGIWIGRVNDKIDFSEITITFSKPVVSMSVIFSHLNNDRAAGREELQNFTVYKDADNVTSSSTFLWTTGPESGLATSTKGATLFIDSTKTIVGSVGVCCEYSSGRITISNKKHFTRITFRHQEFGVRLDANGVVMSDLNFCVYVPPVPVVKKDTVVPKVIPVVAVKEEVKPEVKKVEKKKDILVRPIYFDFDKAVIREDAKVELNKFIGLHKKFPAIRLEINSYSDCRGSQSYNAILSDKRAEAAMKYLIDNGIPANQIIKNGMGEASSDTCGCDTSESDCPDKSYENSRRTEINVLSLKP